MKENNGITMNLYSPLIFPSNIPPIYSFSFIHSPRLFYCNITHATPHLPSNLKKIRNTKDASTIHILTNV